MVRQKKIILAVAACILVLLFALLFKYVCDGYDHDVDGLTAMVSSVRLMISGDDYINVGKDKYVFRAGALRKLIAEQYGEYTMYAGKQGDEDDEESEILYAGTVIKDGKKYNPAGLPIFHQNFYSVNFRPYSEFFYEPHDWGKEKLRLNSKTNVWEVSVDYGATYNELLLEDRIIEIALEEAKKDRYRDEFHQSAIYSQVSSVFLQIGSQQIVGHRHEALYDDITDKAKGYADCIYVVRLMDETDPLNSVILYLDGLTGDVVDYVLLND